MSATVQNGKPQRAVTEPEAAVPAIMGSAPEGGFTPNGDRGSDREEEREFIRVARVEEHEKFEIPANRRRPGYDYLWCSPRVPYSTLRNRRLNDYRAGGFQFCRAEDFPELSGYKPKGKVNQRFVDLGLEDDVRADDPVMLDGNVLMMRPMNLTKQAERERDIAATRQMSDHLRRQRELSERAIGSARTQTSQTYGSAPEEAPSDASAEF